MKKTLTASILAIFSPIFIAYGADQKGYELLIKDIPGIGTGGFYSSSAENFAGFVNSAFNVGIIVAVSLAIIMIVIGGIQYMGGDSFTNKEQAKQKFYNAIIGLLTALGIFLFLNTINPDLVKLKLEISRPNIPKPTIPPVATTPGKYDNLPTVATCYDCMELPSGILVNGVECERSRPEVQARNGRCMVSSQLGKKLVYFKDELERAGIRSDEWWITEAWPPTKYSPPSMPNGIHSSNCHGAGTCIDANFNNKKPITIENINKFCGVVIKNFGSALYEATETDYVKYENKVTGCTLVKTKGTGSHFHFPYIKNSGYTNVSGATGD